MDLIFIVDTQAQGQTFVTMNGGGGQIKDIGRMTDNPTDQENGQADILWRWAKRRQKKGTRMSHT